MVTATMSSAGMRLYVDGVLVGQRTDTTQGEAYLGYWRLGGDNLDRLAQRARPTRNFVGVVDEVAVYPTALSRSPGPGAVRRSQRRAVAATSRRRPRSRRRPPGSRRPLTLPAPATRTASITELRVELRRRHAPAAARPPATPTPRPAPTPSRYRDGQPGRDRHDDPSGHRVALPAPGRRRRRLQPDRDRRLGPGRHRWRRGP